MNTGDLDLAFGDFLSITSIPRFVRKLLATSPELRGVRIILGRPLPGADLDALTRDLEVACVGG